MTKKLNCGSAPAEWPFPVSYGKENRIETDVLIVGAGIAGGMAGLMAARRGLKVAVVDKAPIDVSGSGGAGLDHYLGCYSNPDCAYTPEEYMELPPQAGFPGDGPDHRIYIQMKGAWDNILELEKLGMRFRDEEDEFAGAPFRDDETKIMYAYDYSTKSTIRMRGGAHIKKVMREGLLKEKTVQLFERVMITNLLTEGGKQGARVVGAMGLNEETGEFYVFSAKSVVINTAGIAMFNTNTWAFNSEMFGNGYRSDPNNTGDGIAMAWNAGAEFHSEQQFGQTTYNSPFGWPWYGIGNPDNTWHGCPLVDNKGKEVPWVDPYGDPISSDDIAARTLPAKGQPYMGIIRPAPYIDPELVKNGAYELPFWADITAMPEHERRGLWGLMVGNEGRTRFAIYDYFNKAGFNPEKDMLQCPNMSPENFGEQRKDWFQGEPNNNKFWKADTLKGVSTDWKNMSSIDGLFLSGGESGQGGAAAGSSGSYAGNRAAEFAMVAERGAISEEQVATEKARVYAPVGRMDDPEACIGWKELWMGLNRVMQQDCLDNKSPALCEHGLMWLDSIKKHEMRLTYARNPHELARVLECESRITVAEVYLYLCLANFKDEADGKKDGERMFVKRIGDDLIISHKEDKWWLKPPYAPTYLENYELCTALEKEEK